MLKSLLYPFYLFWNISVTLYKCSVGRPDCSRCLSNITTNSELNCGWCSTDDMCTVQGGSECSGGWMSPGENENCPLPTLMTASTYCYTIHMWLNTSKWTSCILGQKFKINFLLFFKCLLLILSSILVQILLKSNIVFSM